MDEYDSEIMNRFNFVNSLILESSVWQNFKKSFQDKYGKKSSLTLAYVYDGIMLSLQALKQFGNDSEAIRIGFKELTYQGFTRRIAFNKL